MQLFYTPGITDQPYDLNEEESRHCSQVLRQKVGDRIFCTDGEGNIFESEIIETGKRKTTIQIIGLHVKEEENKYYLQIAIAPTKNSERFEWFLEKAVEIGIHEITPLLCEHSERKTLNNDRSDKIIISAMKQSLKSRIPKLNKPVKFTDFIIHSSSASKFIAYCGMDDVPLLKDIYTKNTDAVVLIGPEGDFSINEVKLAEKNGFIPVSLGSSRLRTETAGVFTSSIINIINQ